MYVVCMYVCMCVYVSTDLKFALYLWSHPAVLVAVTEREQRKGEREV